MINLSSTYIDKKNNIEQLLDTTKINQFDLNYDPFKGIKSNETNEKSFLNEKTIFDFHDKYFNLNAKDFDDIYYEKEPNIIKSDDQNVMIDNCEVAKEKTIYVTKNQRSNLEKNDINMEIDQRGNPIKLFIEDTIYSDEILKEKINDSVEMNVETEIVSFKKKKKQGNLRRLNDHDI